jgi:7-keto-8-aminopelargonate synthetase-like enzyme
MGTLGKAFGAAGGYVCGSRGLIHLLVNRARSFIFSTAPVPAAAAAATAGVRLVQSAEGEERRKKLWKNVGEIWRELNSSVTFAGHAEEAPKPSAIIPILIGSESKAMKVGQQLLDRNVLIPAIRFPTVSRGQARLRLTVSAAHSEEQIREALAAIRAVFNAGK